MKSSNLNKFAQNIAQRASLTLFKPHDEELGIFSALAPKGLQVLSSFTKVTSSYGEWEANRWAVKRRMEGTKNNMSLIKCEYISKRQHDTRIRGKDGEMYCLTTKGFMATLSAEKISIEKIYLFKKYKQFIADLLERKIQYHDNVMNVELTTSEKNYLKKIFIQYIKYQIYIFLIWHEANEIGLREKTNTYWYFIDFFENLEEFLYQKFPKLVNNEKIDEYKEILREYFIISSILHGIESFTDEKSNVDKVGKKIRINFQMIKPFVFEWYRYFDRLQMFSPVNKPYNTKAIPSFVIHDPSPGIDIEYSKFSEEKAMINRIETELSEILKKDIRRKISDHTKGTTIHRYKKSSK